LNANAKLVKNYRIDVDDGRAHAICLDLEEESGGTNMGPSGLELALMSFVGCYAIIFMLTAKKMRFVIKDLDVKAEAIKTEAAGTITEARLDIAVATEMPKDRLDRLHSLTVKGCPVGRLFEKAEVEITYNINVKKQ
jgi:uncharacterized OsmC-like protein